LLSTLPISALLLKDQESTSIDALGIS